MCVPQGLLQPGEAPEVSHYINKDGSLSVSVKVLGPRKGPQPSLLMTLFCIEKAVVGNPSWHVSAQLPPKARSCYFLSGSSPSAHPPHFLLLYAQPARSL